jgi:diacylglycerol kinase family enzyme
MMRSLVGRVKQADAFEMIVARELHVRARRGSLDVALDGEVCRLASPLRYRILPRALRIIATAPSA